MTGDPSLAGLRVLDLSRLIPGPYATMLLAQLGATVVKVEPPGEGDYMRLMPPLGPDGMNPIFSALNGGKRSLVLNLREAEGRAALRELARDADVLVESFRPGTLDRLGVGLAGLREANPRLVTCSLAGNAPGPRGAAAGHDVTYQAAAGALALHPGEAQLPALPLADLAGGLFATLGILAALTARATSGSGRHVAVTLEESVGALLLVERAELGVAASFGELLRGGWAGYQLYRCGDGRQLALAALEQKFWEAFCRVVGRPEWTARYMEPEQGGLAGEIAALLATRPAGDWAALLAAADVPAEVVLTLAEARSYAPLPFEPAQGEAPAPRHGEHDALLAAGTIWR